MTEATDATMTTTDATTNATTNATTTTNPPPAVISTTPKKKQKKVKSKCVDPSVLNLRRTVQKCCSGDDLPGAWAARGRATV